jgi:hypothetical protein
MAQLHAFRPAARSLVIAAVNGSSVNGPVPGTGDTLRIFNATNGVVYIAVGVDNSVAAAPPASGQCDYPIEPGASRLVDLGGAGQTGFAVPPALWLAAFLAAGAANGNVIVTRGDGNTQ